MNNKFIIFVTVLITIMAISCISAPQPASPSWTTTTPSPDSTYTYFVGSSSDSAGDEATATEDAANIIMSQITRYMGVNVSVETTGEAKGTLDSYSADVTSVVKQSGESRVSGFSVKDRYVVKQGQMVTVYVLVQYNTKELEAEKARIAALFQERIDAVAKPEAAGDSAANSGRYTEAIKAYVEATIAASGSSIDNAEIKMERNANKARTILGKIGFSRIDAPTNVNMLKDYPKPFSAKLFYGDNAASGKGIAGAEILVSYQRKQNNGRITSRTERIKTGSDGIVSFVPPEQANFVGKATITFVLNLDSSKEILYGMPAKYSNYSDAIMEDMKKRTIAFDYTIVSIARTVPTGIQIIDLDNDGNVLSTTVAQGGLMEAMAKEKFKTGLTNLDTSLIVSMNDAEILNSAKAMPFSSSLKRLVYGTSKIVSVTKDGKNFQAKASLAIRCVEFASGLILYSTDKTAIAIATTEDAATRAALQKVSKDVVAKDLMANLP